MSFNWKTKSDEDIVKFVREQHGRLADRRSLIEDLMSVVVKVFRPRRYNILGDKKKGEQFGADVYDQHPANALAKFVGGKLGYMVSRQIPWIQFVPTYRKLMLLDHVKRYTQEAAEQVLFAAGRSNLYSALTPSAMDAHSVGTAVKIPMRDEIKDRIVFDVVHPKDSYIGVNEFGDCIIYHRSLELTNLTALALFGRDRLPDTWFREKTTELKNPFQENQYIWTVYPNDDRDNSSLRSEDQRYMVLCVLKGRGKKGSLVLRDGTDTFPIVWRSLRESGFEYGISVSMDCLTSALMSNKLSEKALTAAHLAVEPPVIASDTLKRTLHRNPGGKTWVTDINREGVKTWLDRLNWPLTDAQIARLDKQIDDRMFIRFFEMLSSGDFDKVKTAYEVSQMMGEKATLMSTIVDTFEQESLEPSIAVLVRDETRAGRMPDPPDELIETGGRVDIRYIGPLHQLQQTLLRGKSITDAVAIIQQMAGSDETVNWKFNWHEMAEEAAVMSAGLPQRFVHTDEEVRQIQEQAAQKQQMMEQAELAEKIGGAVKDASGPVAPSSALAALTGAEG